MKKTISGIRGIFGDDLNTKHIMEFCSNFATMIGTKCVIGRDTRPSGSIVMNAACAALLANGVDVHNLGISPTPVVFREARGSAGLVITSSHNPLEWNGIKFIINGRGINEHELPHILKTQRPKSRRIGIERNNVVVSSYIDDAVDLVGKIKTHPKVILDVGGGAAWQVAPDMLNRIGCSVHVINEKGMSRGPDPTTDDLSELISNTRQDSIGFAFDLDGDRLVIVCDGKKQPPDVTLGLGIAKSLSMGCKKFVLSIDTSVSVENIITNSGGTVIRSKVGEANVIEQMIKYQAHAGGEGSSGGFILSKFNHCRDGMLASGMIATMLNEPEFHQVLNQMQKYTQIREKISIPSSIHDSVIDALKDTMRIEYSEIDIRDGVKGIIDENSWVLVRKSNTEDIIRISAESNNRIHCQKIVDDVIMMVRRIFNDVR